MRLVATCGLGLETFLAEELRELGSKGIETKRGAVTFEGGWRQVYRSNWRLRTANRVLVELGRWPADTGEALADGARAWVERRDLAWDGVRGGRLLAPSQTLAITASSSASRITDTRWIGLKVKDGLVDGQRQRYGRRSSVDRKDPDLAFRVRLHRDQATLLLDTSGVPLDRRGYRVETTAAPVREQLAAACVLASGWDGSGPVVDPMCGSGTLLAEAASWALGRAPGALRERWTFERIGGFRAADWAAVRAEPIPAPGPRVRLFGVERDAQAHAAARANLTRAGLADRLRLLRGDAFTFEPPPGPGLIAVNPAYGERLDEGKAQWKRLGDLLKRSYAGWRAVVLAGDAGRGKWIGLRPRRRFPVRNGPLDARILTFDLY